MRDRPAQRAKKRIGAKVGAAMRSLTNDQDPVGSTAVRSTRVFLIDDDHSVRRSVSRLLKAAGFEVEAFESGPAFLKKPPHRGDHCLVVDVRMPGMSAVELLETLRTSGHYSPIVFITAHGTDEIRRDLPGETVLTKPIEADVLIAAIDAAVFRSRGGQYAPSARK